MYTIIGPPPLPCALLLACPWSCVIAGHSVQAGGVLLDGAAFVCHQRQSHDKRRRQYAADYYTVAHYGTTQQHELDAGERHAHQH